MLNGSLDLPALTKQRIENAIASLKYQPNPHARRLSRGRSDMIGLVVPDIANPFFATMVAAVEEEANDRGLAVSLYATLNRTGRESPIFGCLSIIMSTAWFSSPTIPTTAISRLSSIEQAR